MTISDQGNGTYSLTLSAGERQMLARAAKRFGVSSFKSALESWLAQAGGAEAEADEIKQAYLKLSDAKVKGDVKAALGVE